MTITSADQLLITSIFSALLSGEKPEMETDQMIDLCWRIKTSDFCTRRGITHEEMTFEDFTDYLDEMENG